MSRPAPNPPTAPLAIRLALLALLPLILLYLYLEGRDFEPDLLELRPAEDEIGKVLPRRLGSLELAAPIRRYHKDNLYEYINGHAEYFISAGFQGLTVAEYGKDPEGQPQVVVNLYQMDSPLSAFGVLMNEAGTGTSLEVGALGFASDQGLSFIQGPTFIQMSLFDPALPGPELGRTLAAPLPGAGRVDLSFGFPPLGKVLETRFVRESYRGLDFLHRVIERRFERDGRELDAFVVSASDGEIQGLTEALNRFIAHEGFPSRTETHQELSFRAVADPYEGDWFYVALPGNLLGVFAALNAALMEEIARFARPSAPDPAGRARGGSR